uniref:Uncharacterized protein n=1 Tax=Arundo donax TaxID=35708 RepID=A0A0A9F9F9_ARUDO
MARAQRSSTSQYCHPLIHGGYG